MAHEEGLKSLFISQDEDASLPGLLVALMTLFDTDGSRTLSQQECGCLTAAAVAPLYRPALLRSASRCVAFVCRARVCSQRPLPAPAPVASCYYRWKRGMDTFELATSDEEWYMLLTRFGSDEGVPGEISFANMVDLFGDIKPVEGFLEEIMRRFMKSLVSLTVRMAGFDDQMRVMREQVSSAAQRQEAARRHTLNRIVRGWRHQHTSRAFDAWRELVQRHRELLVRSGRHWRNALVASVWRRWCTMVSEQREQRRAVASAAGRWRNRLAASAFLMWRDTVVATVERRRMLAGKVMGRWSNRLLASTFAPWLQLTVRSKHTKQLQGRAMMRMVHGLLSSVFWAWAEHAADAGERRQQLLVSNLPPSPHLLTESGVRKVSGMVLVRLARSLCSCLCPYPLLSYAHCLCPCRCPSMCLCHLLHRDGNLLVCLHVSIYVCSGRHGSRIGSSHVRYPWLSTHGGKPRTSAPTIESVSVIELSSASVTVSQRWRLRLGTNT